MFPLAKVLHVLAVALWFGAGLFFTFVVGLSLSDTFEKETAVPSGERPFWLPAPRDLEKARPSERFPDPLLKEQGSRIFGAAVGPMFRPYYILQVACGALAVLTGLAWWGRGGVHRWRVVVLVLALAGAGLGWWLEREVEALREERSKASDVVLKGESPSAAEVRVADEAREKFGLWHTYSLFANFGTLGLVTAAMVMAAFLPPRERLSRASV
jgi:hypothetical protein